MKNLMLSGAAIALLAACGGADKVTTPTTAVLEEASARTGDPAQAAAALAAMSLDASATGVLSFADSSVEGATATFTDVKVSGEEAVNVGTLKLDGLDMTDGKANFGKLSLNAVTLDGGDEGDVVISNIELVNPSPELAAWIAGTLNGEEVAFPAADKLVFDSWSVGDLSATISDSDMDGTFGIEKIEILDKGVDTAAQAKISGLSLDGLIDGSESLKASLGSITLTNVDTKFVQAVQENMDEPEAMMSALMDIVSDNPMETGYDAFSLSDLSFDIAGAAFALPSLTSFVERNTAGEPTKYITEPFSMSLSADPEGGEAGAGLLQGLSILGYESLELKGSSVAEYDPATDMVSMAAADNFFELVDGMKISFGGKIEGYSAYSKAAASAFDFEALAAGGDPDPSAIEGAFSELTFHGFELSLADDTLLDRAFNAAATSQGVDPAELKSQIGMGLAMAPMMAQGSGIDMALISEATGAIGKFVSDGGTLTLKVDPSEPLSVAAIMENPDPAAYTKDRLGFTASQN